MWNIIESFVSGFGEAILKLFGSPLDFLAGKSCSTACGATWDLFCYIENFCISRLLKLAAVSFLLYTVLLLLYSSYKLGICQCIFQTLFKSAWACFAVCFHAFEYSCYFLRRRKHKRCGVRDVELELEDVMSGNTSEEKDDEGSFYNYHYVVPHNYRHTHTERSVSRPARNYKEDRLRRSLRPRMHRVRLGVGKDTSNRTRYGGSGVTLHDIRVTQTSKFTHKGGNGKRLRHNIPRKM